MNELTLGEIIPGFRWEELEILSWHDGPVLSTGEIYIDDGYVSLGLSYLLDDDRFSNTMFYLIVPISEEDIEAILEKNIPVKPILLKHDDAWLHVIDSNGEEVFSKIKTSEIPAEHLPKDDVGLISPESYDD